MAATETVRGDDRLQASGLVRRLLNRPELGAAAGAVAVWIIFAVEAGATFRSTTGAQNYLDVASLLGIVAVPVALLMIAGEFDLSVGSIVGASGMTVALAYDQFGWNVWAAILLAVVVSLAIGFLNGLVVVKTRLPSFIVTLGTLFIVRGLTIGITRYQTGRTQIGGIGEATGYDAANGVLGRTVDGWSVAIVWWLAIAVLATWVLLRTRFGNWIFGAGGAPDAARNLGVPVNRVKISLFMTTALASCLVGVIEVLRFTGTDTLRGETLEFQAIIAAVVGGTLLTGGYGSAVGAVLGALIWGMVSQGIVFAGIDPDWERVFLGGLLILAVLVNNYIRKKAAEVKR